MPFNKNKYYKTFGNGDKKAIVIAAPNKFSAWGEHAKDAQSEGWYPESSYGSVTEYRSPYDNQFNQVVDPNSKQRAYVTAIGNNNNGLFSLVLKDKNGNVLKDLFNGAKVPAQTVRNYFTNPQSTIAQRANSIAAGTNTDRMINGTYTPLQ